MRKRRRIRAWVALLFWLGWLMVVIGLTSIIFFQGGNKVTLSTVDIDMEKGEEQLKQLKEED